MATALRDRWQGVLIRLDVLEQHPLIHAARRWATIESRLRSLEQQAGIDRVDSLQGPAEPSRRVDPEPPADASATQQRLHRELVCRGFTYFQFVRVPGAYYDQSLEWRQEQLGAASIHHLCKSIVAENTRAHPSIVHPTDPLHPDNWKNPNNSRYYVIIVQYSARLNFEKLKALIHGLNGDTARVDGGKFGKQFFNIRLAPEDVNDALSGYEHNAVSPIGMAADLPIIMTHKITELQPDFFFVGGGEVDLKLGFSASEFVKHYKPLVADITF